MITNVIKIFDQNIPITGYNCNTYAKTDESYAKTTSSIGLYVYIQNKCNAKCKFCNIHNEKHVEDFDFCKFDKALAELKNKIRVAKIGITGGEPLLDINLLDEVIKHINSYFENIPITIHTNGSFLKNLMKCKELNRLNAIHISRHHFNSVINNEIFGVNASEDDAIQGLNKFLKNKNNLYLNCLLIKNYIDNTEKMKEYLEWALSLDIKKVAFVDLTDLNDFCKNNFVNLYNRKLIKLDSFSTDKPIKNSDFCSCCFGEYSSKIYKDKTATIFFRQTKSYPIECFHYLEFKDNKIFAGNNGITVS